MGVVVFVIVGAVLAVSTLARQQFLALAQAVGVGAGAGLLGRILTLGAGVVGVSHRLIASSM